MQIDEIKERLRILRNVQQAFVDEKDWIEASRIQYDIDELLQAEAREKKPWKMELWFRIALMELALKLLKADVSKIIYSLEWQEELKNQKPS